MFIIASWVNFHDSLQLRENLFDELPGASIEIAHRVCFEKHSVEVVLPFLFDPSKDCICTPSCVIYWHCKAHLQQICTKQLAKELGRCQQTPPSALLQYLFLLRLAKEQNQPQQEPFTTAGFKRGYVTPATQFLPLVMVVLLEQWRTTLSFSSMRRATITTSPNRLTPLVSTNHALHAWLLKLGYPWVSNIPHLCFNSKFYKIPSPKHHFSVPSRELTRVTSAVLKRLAANA